jgi:hypothetical protein
MRALLAALLLAIALPALGDKPCPPAAEADQADLLGLWLADFDGTGHVATLLLTKRPKDEESFHGRIDRNGEQRLLAGDIDDGTLTLEESADGVHIAATWLGDVVEGSCAREIRGTWTADGDEAHPHAFVLRRR